MNQKFTPYTFPGRVFLGTQKDCNFRLFFSEFNRFSNLKEFQFQTLFSFFGVVKNVVDDLFKLNAILN